MNCRCHILIEETLDEIGQRLEHTPQKSLKHLSQKTGASMSSVQRATTLLKLHIGLHIVNYTCLHNENSCLGMSQIAIITTTTLTTLTYNNNHN